MGSTRTVEIEIIPRVRVFGFRRLPGYQARVTFKRTLIDNPS